MGDDETSSKSSEFSAGTRSSTAPKPRRGLGRGLRTIIVPSVSDSGLGISGPSHEASVGDSHSVSSRVDKLSISEAFTDAEEFLTATEDEPVDGGYKFSNINCLFFGELRKNSFQIYKYDVSFSRTLTKKDRQLLFLKKKVIDDIGETLLQPNGVLYASKLIAADKLNMEITLHGEAVKIGLSPSDTPLKFEDFFSCLLRRMSLYLTEPRAFVALNLMSHQNRFEVYPGEVVDVAEREFIVRCGSSFHLDLGRVSDIIEECFIYAAIRRVDEAMHREIVERNLRELVVHNETDKKTYVIERILWDDDSRTHIPLLRCRRLKTDTTVRLPPSVLLVAGSRRTSQTIAERQGSGGSDKTTSFVGDPATGQQRQLAMVRYKEIMDQEDPQKYLHQWGITLGDTKVISNGVALETEMLRMQGQSNLATSQGWIDRLYNLRVLVPVRIKNWYIIYEKGDERLVDDMIENLKADAPKIGIEMREPRKRAIVDIKPEAYEGLLNSCLHVQPNIELFMVIVRSSRTDIYNAVKRWSLGHRKPIVTQVIMRDTAKQICNMLDYSLSVITQINCKLGGALWSLDATVGNTLVIGLSLYTSGDGKDVLGFVSSRNTLFTRWYSYAIMDREKELKEQLKIAIKKFSLENANALPQRIIILSNQIDDEEFPQEIAASVRAVFDGNLTLVHVEDIARFNETVHRLAKAGQIDELKSMQKKYLFVPQRAGKELDMICCRLDFNDAGLKNKEIAGVIKQLKHVYYNVAGEVNLPAPVLYAERCAEFVAEVLGGGVQYDAIRDTLYYL